MSNIKPSDHGIVVDHKESGTRFAISDKNYNEKVHRKVRDLRPGETVRAFQPKRRSELSEGAPSTQGSTSTPDQADGSAPSGSEALADASVQATHTEGAAPAASQEKKGK